VAAAVGQARAACREDRRMVYRVTSDHVWILIVGAYAFAEHRDRDISHLSSASSPPLVRAPSDVVSALSQAFAAMMSELIA
jgi:hypothetical protein